MRFIERHGEVCSCFFELPFLDFAGISIDDRNLADRCEVDKNPRPLFLQLERLRVAPSSKSPSIRLFVVASNIPIAPSP
jgi:hypothetical protein